MSKHTPGPWSVSKRQPGDGKHILVESDGHDNWNRLACEVDSDDCNSEMAAANARLIAASPDLLTACQKAVKELNEIRARDGVPYTRNGWKASVDEGYFSSVVDECFAAIAKATGGAQ